MKERNRSSILNTISFGLSNARIEQDQAPHNAKLMVQERGINAYHGVSQLLQPENPSSKEAFLEAIAVWVTIYCVFLPTFISEEPKIDNNPLCRHQKPWWRAADWHLFSDAGGKGNLHQRNNWWWHLLSCNGRASLFGSICTWKKHKPALCKYFHFPDYLKKG